MRRFRRTDRGRMVVRSRRELFRVAEVDDSKNSGSHRTSGVAERYAQALFSLAQEQNVTDAVADALQNFAGMIEESADLKRLVLSPVFSAEEQLKAVSALLGKYGFGGITANFIKLVAAKRRLFVLPDMIRAFADLNDRAKGVTRAAVTVAAPLSSDHSAALEEALRQVSGGKTVKVNVNVDPSIIGGIVVKLGSRMVDASLKTKLNSLRTRMKEVG
jgi:F-type H+-transporting ATPase subunit delta